MPKSERKKMLESILSKLIQDKIDVNLYLGNEIYFSDNIYELLENEIACSINDTNYILFELPMNAKPMNLYDVVYDMLEYKLIPILAHPERYSFVQKDPDLVYDLVKKGVLMQCNYASIIGQYGEKAKIIMKKLLENNMVHFLGSDVHKAGTVYPKIPMCIKKIEEIIGEDNFEVISTVNPAEVLANRSVDIVEPSEIKLSFREKLILKK